MNINDPSRWAATTPPFEMGQQRMDAMLTMQKELLGAYEEASRAWLGARAVGSPALDRTGEKLTLTRSVPGPVAAYQECVAQGEDDRPRRTTDRRGIQRSGAVDMGN